MDNNETKCPPLASPIGDGETGSLVTRFLDYVSYDTHLLEAVCEMAREDELLRRTWTSFALLGGLGVI